MKSTEKRLLDILEPAGLALMIRGALGRAEMIRIANASRVSVPGMRNRSVALEHLSEALADKFVAEGPSRKTILKALTTAVRSTLPAYRKQDVEELRARLSDAERVRADSDLGKLLFLLLIEPRDGITTEEIRAAVLEATRGAAPREPGAVSHAAPAETETEIHALRREKAELSRRAADLVALVDRLRERDRRFREEIAQRKFDVNNFKLQLAKAKRERESLEKEVRSLTGKLDQAEKKPVLPQDLSGTLAASLAETRRLASAMEKLQARLREERATPVQAAFARTVEELKRETSEIRKALGAEKERSSKAIEELPGRVAEAVRAPGEGRGRTAVDRVGVFVDVQNMFYAARGVNARLDFDVLLQTATRNRRLIRAVAYVVEAREIDQSGFIALLKSKRYEVKRKDLKVRSDGSFKGDWDMEIALDALEMADALDVVVLVTGDGDFTGLVQKLKTRGPRVEVYSFPQNTAKELREAADKFVSIDKRMLIKMSRVMPGAEPTGTAGG